MPFRTAGGRVRRGAVATSSQASVSVGSLGATIRPRDLRPLSEPFPFGRANAELRQSLADLPLLRRHQLPQPALRIDSRTDHACAVAETARASAPEQLRESHPAVDHSVRHERTSRCDRQTESHPKASCRMSPTRNGSSLCGARIMRRFLQRGSCFLRKVAVRRDRRPSELPRRWRSNCGSAGSCVV